MIYRSSRACWGWWGWGCPQCAPPPPRSCPPHWTDARTSESSPRPPVSRWWSALSSWLSWSLSSSWQFSPRGPGCVTVERHGPSLCRQSVSAAWLVNNVRGNCKNKQTVIMLNHDLLSEDIFKKSSRLNIWASNSVWLEMSVSQYFRNASLICLFGSFLK